MSIDNEAISLRVQVDISWYRIGHQFAELYAEDQYQFFVGMLDNIQHWEGAIASGMQQEYIVEQFNEHNPSRKRELAEFFDNLSERLTRGEL